MIGYVTIGTNKFDEAAAFYDGLLAVMGGQRFMDEDTFIAWGAQPNQPMLSIIKPFNGEAATVGNGMMVSLVVENTDKVQAMHAKALELGAENEGDPGPRGNSGFYAAYFRDLDGNKLACFTMG